MNKFSHNDQVMVFGQEGYIGYVYTYEEDTYDVRLDSGPVVTAVTGDRLKRVIPPAPPKGSLVKIGDVTYYCGNLGFYRIAWNGAFENYGTPVSWEGIYKPGYKVATFN